MSSEAAEPDLVSAVGRNRLEGLRSLRDHLAAKVVECRSFRDLAPLSQRLMDTLEQIEAVERAQPATKGTALDEFTRRRAERQAASPSRSSKRQQRG